MNRENTKQLRIRFTKRSFDLILSCFLIFCLWPVIVLATLWIFFSSPGNPFFLQKRCGYMGKPFTIFKLRTMHNKKRDGTNFTALNDERIIFGGKFLRHTRVDELPQLLNVITGEMSLIGPRPEQFELAARYGKNIPTYGLRHNVYPGITGLAQVKLGYVDDEKGTQKKVKLDLFYIKHQSVCLDLRICIETLKVIAHMKGAR